MEWVGRTRYLGVTLGTRFTWSPHIDQVRKRTAQKMGMLVCVPNRKSDLSVRNGFLLYKHLIRPMMNYVCPAWRSTACSHVRRLQVLQSKCLRLATGVPCYVSNRQIHEDLGVPLFTDHIRALTGSFDSKLADVEHPPCTATRQIPTLTEGSLRRLRRTPRAPGASRPVEAIASDGQVDQTNRVRRWSAEHLSANLIGFP
jgi:hypothetical protein